MATERHGDTAAVKDELDRLNALLDRIYAATEPGTWPLDATANGVPPGNALQGIREDIERTRAAHEGVTR